ncbi:MAG: adenylate/guanylate cyclase domain-containing protein [Merismopedia sp. SIO2A8]|nr:adenylate/guanylate cyclase domain-containing protein [Symploca sp. SIO2B6]NET47618.1 adenylate/guanylate cyclase domain-containing protein [Merismopedia sp. SIO2A8]
MRFTQQLYHSSKTWFSNRQIAPTTAGALIVLAISLVNTGLLLTLKYMGRTQSLELIAYDRAVYARKDQLIDDRIVVVGVTDDYINETGKINPDDNDLTTVLRNLLKYNPSVIGVDLYRNIPQSGRDSHLSTAAQGLRANPGEYPAWETLLQEFQNSNVISITTFASETSVAIPPPPTVPLEQVGFNDLLIDTDNVVRRSLLMGWHQDPEAEENPQFYFSLAMTLAIHYLAELPNPVFPGNSTINPDYLQLGETTFIPLTPDAGGYDQGDTEGYQIFLNYHSRYAVVPSANYPEKEIGIPSVSFLDVLTDTISSEDIEGKIVLIGSTSPTLKDLFSTPYSHNQDQRMPGVFIHAQTVSQVLDAALGHRPLLWFWPSWGEALWIFGWAIAGGTLALRCRSFWLLMVATSAIVGIQGISFHIILTYNGWIPVVAPVLSSLLTIGGMVAYQAQQAQQQRNIMKSLLGQSISPAIADELWKSRNDILRSGKLPGQKLTATVLFSDIKGFSTLSEKQPPDELLDWLNEYLKEMIEAVVAHGGIVNKFTGDGMLAVFGVPIKRTEQEVTEDARQAVRCALAMRQALDELNEKWQDKHMPHVQDQVIQMRVGIFTGTVTAGSIGSKERLEYGVIGDSVNTASRLESCLKARQEDDCRILIANETMQHLISPDLFMSKEFQDITNIDGQGFFIPFSMLNTDTMESSDRPQLEIESWGPRVLKGKDHKVNVYRIVGLVSNAEAQSTLDYTEIPKPTGTTLHNPPQKSTFITEPQ